VEESFVEDCFAALAMTFALPAMMGASGDEWRIWASALRRVAPTQNGGHGPPYEVNSEQYW